MNRDALNDVVVRKARPQETPYKLTDGRGMYLLVNSTGKYWRLDYRFEGARKTLALGVYPDVPLSKARERRDTARQQIADGVDPGRLRKIQKRDAAMQRASTFESVARQWYATRDRGWSDDHAEKILAQFEQHIFPYIGQKPIREITSIELLTVLRRIEERGAIDTAHRALSNCNMLFRYAILKQRADSDPTTGLKAELQSATRSKHHAAIIDPRKIGPLLRDLDGYTGSFITQCALRLAPLVFVRPGELRQAEWGEIDLDAATWVIPAQRMKMEEELIVPLSTQAVAILKDLQSLTGGGRYVFPNSRTATRPMSNNTVLAALRRMGYDKEAMTGHGFRAMARTVLDEVLEFRTDIIEQQLAHVVKDPNGRAYNRTKHLSERRRMMQSWADWLDQQLEKALTPL